MQERNFQKWAVITKGSYQEYCKPPASRNPSIHPRTCRLKYSV